MEDNKAKIFNIFHIISKIISWSLFVILILMAAFLLYYFVATKIYVAKGPGYEPKFSIYTIISGSMDPTIKVYDTVVNVRADKSDDIKVGDVITFISSSLYNPGTTVTHRVVAIEELDGEACYRTKGDHNPVEDQACAKYDNVIGKVIVVIPQLGRIQFFLASKAGWLLCILIPALYVIIKDILRIIKLTTIKNTTTKMMDKKKDPNKIRKETERKKELKRKLAKNDDNEYYKDPDVKVVDKRKKKK